MPVNIRALAVILFLSGIIFIFAKRPACGFMRQADFCRRRNLWIAITLTAFLASNFWVYALLATAFLLFMKSDETNPVALYFLLLFAVPALQFPIPGMGLVNYFFNLSHQRLLIIVILLPAYFVIIAKKQTAPFGRTMPDKLIAAYIIFRIILHFGESTPTDTLRAGFYHFIDVFLPYFVISRSLGKAREFREAILSFVVAVMVLSFIALFESVMHWLLYDSLRKTLELTARISGSVTPSAYDIRAGLQRANASVGAIPLGYVITVGIGLYMYLRKSIKSHFSYRLGFVLLATGLVASLSRGPWVGAAFLFFVFIALGRRPKWRLTKFLVACVLALSLASILPGGDKIVDLIPYVGKSEQGNINYRQKLIENATIVILRNPFIGSYEYLNEPEMEAMRQGQDIIDIVNTYVGIALENGIIGLCLFLGFFMTICWGIYWGLRRLPDKDSDEYLLGQALLSTLAAILLIIFTVSSISVIPVVYWSVAGLGAAYINMLAVLRRQHDQSDKPLVSKT